MSDSAQKTFIPYNQGQVSTWLFSKYNITDIPSQELNKLISTLNFNQISLDTLSDEIDAKLFNLKDKTPTITLTLIDSSLKSIDERSQIEKKRPKKIHMNFNSQNVYQKKVPIQTSSNSQTQISFSLKQSFCESENFLPKTNQYNTLINLENISIIPQYDLIAKDDSEIYNNYTQYFKKVRTELLATRNIKEDDSLLNISKFVLFLTYRLSETKPTLNELIGVDPLDNFNSYSLGFENIEDKEYAFVSGQIVYLEGDLIDKKRIHVKFWQHGFPLVSYSIQEQEIKRFYNQALPYCIYTLNGPFYSKSNIDLSVFHGIIQAISEDQPNLVIINGPFIYSENDVIKSCQLSEDTPFTYNDLFEKMISLIKQTLKCKVVIIPSLTDELNYYPLPQPPFEIDNKPLLKDENIIYVGNPQLLPINEMIFAIVNYDFIRDINNNIVKDKRSPIDTSIDILLSQKNMYPLIPNYVNGDDVDKMDKVNIVELSQIDKMAFDIFPDVIITNSAMQPFVKKYNSTIVINGGSVFKGKAETPGNVVKIMEYPPNVSLIYIVNINIYRILLRLIL
jgi:hypothetical protein